MIVGSIYILSYIYTPRGINILVGRHFRNFNSNDVIAKSCTPALPLVVFHDVIGDSNQHEKLKSKSLEQPSFFQPLPRQHLLPRVPRRTVHQSYQYPESR